MTHALISAGINSIWQGLILTFLAWTLITRIRRLNAASRHDGWLIVLVIVSSLPLLPMGAFVFAGTDSATAGATTTLGTSAATAHPDPTNPPWMTGVGSVTSLTLPDEHGGITLALWLFGLSLLACRYGLQLLAIYRIRARSTNAPDHLRAILESCRDESGVTRSVTLFLSDEIDVPATIGAGRPMVLLPTSMPGRLSDGDLRNILLHELAHVARGDFRFLLLQRCIATVWFFHPSVWWIGRRLELERELACDERVIGSTGGRTRGYVGSLVRVGEFALAAGRRRQRQLLLPMASQLRRRVERLHNGTGCTTEVSLRRVSSLAALVAVAAVLLGGSHAIGVVPPSESDSPLTLAMTGLRSPDPMVRAQTAFSLSRLRQGAIPAIPALIDLLQDETPVRRLKEKTSVMWGRPHEHPRLTSPGEEALKALLHIGRPAIQPLQDVIERHDQVPDSEAVWALNLLRDFD